MYRGLPTSLNATTGSTCWSIEDEKQQAPVFATSALAGGHLS
jgi:hypothetical protein